MVSKSDINKVYCGRFSFFLLPNMYSLGICFGSSTLTAVLLEKAGGEGSFNLKKTWRLTHHGNPLENLKIIYRAIDREFGGQSGSGREIRVATTGRKFRQSLDLFTIPEAEATELALGFVDKGKDVPRALISAGGETVLVYILDNQGKIKNIQSGNKCASGTGEFFLQQVRRMNLGPEEAVKLAANCQEYKVSGRCSVFCKSDCTHALNKGIPVGEVAAGLCRMMAKKITALLYKIPKDRIMIVGGVTANQIVMKYLRQEIQDLIIPEEAPYFEALGAALAAADDPRASSFDLNSIKQNPVSEFHYLPPLTEHFPLVEFKEGRIEEAKPNDRCLIGLDVGSTTTKAVILRLSDNAILGSIYLRTNGNPVEASRQCYRALANDIKVPLQIVGLGVTGSGRQIAGLHAQTDEIINEIIAHARASAYFDPEVDTIFEIGGQDAKYTYLINGVPTDYAMNEACSAGTGSFLEESGKECLGIEFTEIADIALKGKNPPNFNDQCSAFINSDIINAAQAGFGKEDITGGLVYSICMNYLNRVKGARPVGRKVFMQGGTCYNRAIPYAMAGLLEKPIIVPPFAGLMGAFGVALAVKERLEKDLSQEKSFDLKELADREIEYGKSFICRADKHCDRNCSVINIKISGKNYPFGGACNKYYNLVHHLNFEADDFNEVIRRQEKIFESYEPTTLAVSVGLDEQKETVATRKNIGREINGTEGRTTSGTTSRERRVVVGLNRSFLTNHLLPLYNTFFRELGCDVVLPDKVQEEGVQKMGAPFCYPAEAAHGLFQDLLNKKPDFIFLPHVKELYQKNSISYRKEYQSTCLILQGEPYYLRSAFKKELVELNKLKCKILSPVLNFSQGWETQTKQFAALAKQLGFSEAAGRKAYQKAWQKQKEVFDGFKQRGRELLQKLAQNPDLIAVVVFGRPYNAYAPEVNLNIPHKFASRGILTIPFDHLPFEDENCPDTMHWAIGQMIMKAAQLVKKHPQLFAVYVTNFSCGPDSFLIGYFRDIMGRKPSLTLELDSHTADAGVGTRIEAFLDVISHWRRTKQPPLAVSSFKALKAEREKGKLVVKVPGRSDHLTLYDPEVKVVLPSMGPATIAVAAILEGDGIKAETVPQPDLMTLKKGRSVTSGKECVPLTLVTGSLVQYLEKHPFPKQKILYFMPAASGGCRFGQYSVFLNNYIEKMQKPNIGILTLDTDSGYAGLNTDVKIRIFKAIIACDILTDVKNILTVLAVDKKEALAEYDKIWNLFLETLRKKGSIEKVLGEITRRLKKIPLKYSLAKAKKALLVGEVYTRLDQFSCRGIAEKLAERDIILLTAPGLEWLYYVDFLVKEGLVQADFTWLDRIKFIIENKVKFMFEAQIKNILAGSELYDSHMAEVEKTIEYGKELLSIFIGGDPILSVGTSLREILNKNLGIILIGPFACMQSRLTEAILNENLNLANKEKIEGHTRYSDNLPGLDDLPFMAIETDGNAFPQLIAAKLEAFCLQVERVHKKMAEFSH